jgi:ATP-dependent DNA helicase PIF1
MRTSNFHDGLGPSQLKAYAKIINNESVFVTGSAGTGKTELLKRITDYWNSIDHKYAITASTGIAAINICGKTFHSFMWLRPEDEEPDVTAESIVQRLSKSKFYKYYLSIMTNVQTLVIDEISMLGPSILEKSSDVLKIVRRCGEPFGGLQLVLVGDFFQLPAVKAPKFLFELDFFKQCVSSTETLTEVFRQKDTSFIELLGHMRTGTLTESDHELLESRVGADISRFGIVPTELWSTNKDVDQLNNDKLTQIKTPIVTFKSYHGMKSPSGFQQTAMDKFIKDMHIAAAVDLKGPLDGGPSGPSDIGGTGTQTGPQTGSAPCGAQSGPQTGAPCGAQTGAQVMLTYNLNTERGLVNGSRGVIVGFEAAPDMKCVSTTFFDEYDGFTDKAFVRQVPMPKVRFLCDGHPVTILVPYVCISRKSAMEGLKTKATCYAWIMPLKLAWATTVHKSQGQSLDCVKATLDKSIFADGQAYVAVSRARTLEGLTLTSYDRNSVRANAAVKKFYGL